MARASSRHRLSMAPASAADFGASRKPEGSARVHTSGFFPTLASRSARARLSAAAASGPYRSASGAGRDAALTAASAASFSAGVADSSTPGARGLARTSASSGRASGKDELGSRSPRKMSSRSAAAGARRPRLTNARALSVRHVTVAPTSRATDDAYSKSESGASALRLLSVSTRCSLTNSSDPHSDRTSHTYGSAKRLTPSHTSRGECDAKSRSRCGWYAAHEKVAA
mmetsp:Transcript_17501/g.57251  ORF Transcript_17501/g.57251 Transcript_17501/m.57251 type:complete len:228 (-) Transcript_17501:119-802(-)